MEPAGPKEGSAVGATHQVTSHPAWMMFLPSALPAPYRWLDKWCRMRRCDASPGVQVQAQDPEAAVRPPGETRRRSAARVGGLMPAFGARRVGRREET